MSSYPALLTAANIANLRNDVEKSVVISGPLSVEESVKGLLRKEKLPFKGTILRTICNFERNAAPDLFPLNALDAVKSGRTKYLFAHSTDDSMVPYDRAGRDTNTHRPNSVAFCFFSACPPRNIGVLLRRPHQK